MSILRTLDLDASVFAFVPISCLIGWVHDVGFRAWGYRLGPSGLSCDKTSDLEPLTPAQDSSGYGTGSLSSDFLPEAVKGDADATDMSIGRRH